jgi:hypothetical protein
MSQSSKFVNILNWVFTLVKGGVAMACGRCQKEIRVFAALGQNL